jgi:hypothetical protein
MVQITKNEIGLSTKPHAEAIDNLPGRNVIFLVSIEGSR